MQKIAEIVETLQKASDQYYNEGESFLTDAEYDALELELREIDPTNPFLIGVGADVRGDKVRLPFPMGSLDQVYEGETENWIENENLQNEEIVVSDKLDGTSIMLVYGDDGALQIAFSRGNGVEGQDVTRHVRKMKKVPQKISGKMAVRAEVIMEDPLFENLGVDYKNPRNYVAGQMNSEESNNLFYDNVDIVAYEVVEPIMKKEDQFKLLIKEGISVAGFLIFEGHELDDELLKIHLTTRINQSPYALDGVVLDLNDLKVRKKLQSKKSRDNLNPAFAKKFKIGQEDNIATAKVVAVHWKVSKTGYLKPRVEIEPVDLVGVTITYATGFNGKFIRDHGVGPGAEVKITRSGDVIPYILEVEKFAQPALPDEKEFGAWSWTENEVDIVLDDVDNNDDVAFQQLVAGMKIIGLEHIAGRSLEKLFEAGYRKVEDVILADPDKVYEAVGSRNAYKGMDMLKDKLNGIELEKLAAASSAYGRGMGQRRLKKVVAKYGTLFGLTLDQVLAVESFSTITAQQVLDGEADFKAFLDAIDGNYSLAKKKKEKAKAAGGALSGEYFVFTGVRDAELTEKIEAQGAEVGSSMSKVTVLVAKDTSKQSGKMKKALEKGVKVISYAEALDMV